MGRPRKQEKPARSRSRPRKKRQIRNSRKLRYDNRLFSGVQPILLRLRYLCQFVFAADPALFAQTIGLEHSHVKRVLADRLSITTKFLAQVTTGAGVRSEWLLNGVGPVFVKNIVEELPVGVPGPQRLSTMYPVFDTSCTGGLPVPLPMLIDEQDVQPKLTPEHISAAQAIHTARAAEKPVLWFLGAPAFLAGAGIVVGDCLRQKYATGVAMTGRGVMGDIAITRTVAQPDLNYLARLAAAQGLGYGETLGRFGFEQCNKRERSLLHAAYSLNVPASVHVEIGELCQHAYATVRGAELGAAVGAATYTDFLIFTEQVRHILQAPGGVFVLVGDIPRGLNLFLQAYNAVKSTGAEPSSFTVLFLDTCVHADLQEQVRSHGGQNHTLQGTYRANVLNLLNACNAVYSGKIPHDLRQKCRF